MLPNVSTKNPSKKGAPYDKSKPPLSGLSVPTEINTSVPTETITSVPTETISSVPNEAISAFSAHVMDSTPATWAERAKLAKLRAPAVALSLPPRTPQPIGKTLRVEPAREEVWLAECCRFLVKAKEQKGKPC